MSPELEAVIVRCSSSSGKSSSTSTMLTVAVVSSGCRVMSLGETVKTLLEPAYVNASSKNQEFGTLTKFTPPKMGISVKGVFRIFRKGTF